MSRFPKLRFSLLTLLLSTVIVALGISYFFVQRRATKLSVENRLLREELGVIEVEDPNKFYFRELPSHSPLTWRFRVFVPETSEAKLAIAAGFVDEYGEIPEASALSNIHTGQYEIVVSVSPIGQGNKGLRISVWHPLGQMTIGRYQGELDWILDDENKRERRRFHNFAKGENETIETDASGRVNLFSVFDADTSSDFPVGLGFFIEFPKQQNPLPEEGKSK